MTAAAGTYLPGLGLALAIGLLLGVERGWQARDEEAGRRVAGIRTFAMLGLLGGLAGIVARGDAGAILATILVAGAILALLLGYRADMARDGNVSATTTLAGVLALGLGAMASGGEMALASVAAGATVLLLASREGLHHALRMANERDIKALLRLVLVVFIVLPLLPDRPMGPLDALNPFRLWTVVVVTGSISFFGYILVRVLGEQRGAMLTAGVGALVSSTAVTVDGARRVREGAGISAHAAVALASTVMLVRSLFLVSVVAPMAFASFAGLILPGLLASALSAAMLLYLGRAAPASVETSQLKPPGLGLALLFALSVAILSIASVWAEVHWGDRSGAVLIALGGTADIDAAIAAVGALPPGRLPAAIAAVALAAPTLFNTLFKLGLFVTMAGWRRSAAGAMALAATSVALLIPIAIALA